MAFKTEGLFLEFIPDILQSTTMNLQPAGCPHFSREENYSFHVTIRITSMALKKAMNSFSKQVNTLPFTICNAKSYVWDQIQSAELK